MKLLWVHFRTTLILQHKRGDIVYINIFQTTYYYLVFLLYSAPQSFSQANGDQHQQMPCQLELQRFMKCAENQSDLTFCEQFHQSFKDCKMLYSKLVALAWCIALNSEFSLVCLCRHSVKENGNYGFK